MPEEYILGGVPGGKKSARPENVQIVVHFGPKQEIVAMGTIDMDDLDNLVGVGSDSSFWWNEYLVMKPSKDELSSLYHS